MTELDQYKNLYEEFCEWVLGIEEDDPLPPEIKFVYFVFSTNHGMNVLQYAGCEFEPKTICSFDYFPLEAQFLHSREFLKIGSEKARQFAALFSSEIKNDERFGNLFFKKKIAFVEFGVLIKQ